MRLFEIECSRLKRASNRVRKVLRRVLVTDLIDPLLDEGLVGRDGFERRQMLQSAGVAPLFLLERGELAEELGVEKDVGFRLAGFALAPVLQPEFPKVSGAGGVFAILRIDPAEFEEQFVVARVGPKPHAKELLGLVHLAQRAAHPVGADDVGLDAFGIQFRGEAEPRKNLPLVAGLLFALSVLAMLAMFTISV